VVTVVVKGGETGGARFKTKRLSMVADSYEPSATPELERPQKKVGGSTQLNQGMKREQTEKKWPPMRGAERLSSQAQGGRPTGEQ